MNKINYNNKIEKNTNLHKLKVNIKIIGEKLTMYQHKT